MGLIDLLKDTHILFSVRGRLMMNSFLVLRVKLRFTAAAADVIGDVDR